MKYRTRLTIDSVGRLAHLFADGTTVPVVRGGDESASTPQAQLPDELASRVEGITELSDEELADLERDLQSHLEEVTDTDDITDDVIAQATVTRDAIRQVWTDTQRRYDAAAEADAEAERRRAELEAIVSEVNPDDGEGDGDEENADGDNDADGEQAPPTGDADADDDEDDQEAETPQARAAAAQRPRIGQVNARARSQRNRERRRQETRTQVLRPRATLVAAAATDDLRPGDEITNVEQLARAFTDVAHSMRNVRGGDGARFTVARLSVEYPEDRMLRPGDTAANQRKLADLTRPQAIAAAGGLCAPLMPDYTVPQISDASRRLPQALARMGAERGGITWVPAPVLGDYDAGVDDWTAANDANPTDPTTKPCVEVDCDSPSEVTVDAITKCLQVGNFIARTYDERVQAIVELLDATWARHAEAKHLTTIGSGSTQITAGENLSATRDILTVLDRAIAAERDRFRMSDTEPLRWMQHRLVRSMIRADLAREIPGSSDERLATADATIDSFFAARGVNVTWLMDAEGGAVFGAQANGALSAWPTSVVGYLFHEGAWVFLDGGTLDLGIVRDSTLNSTNDFQIFAESWEAVAKKGIFSRRISMDVCPSGWTSAPVDFDPCATGS